MILLIDNYDSFSYNLVQLAGAINSNINVIRNDELTVKEIKEMRPSHIIISPGPGHPKNAGICEELVEQMKGYVPILGICLGHQAICEVFGASIVPAKRLMHGETKRCSYCQRKRHIQRPAPYNTGGKIPFAHCAKRIPSR